MHQKTEDFVQSARDQIIEKQVQEDECTYKILSANKLWPNRDSTEFIFFMFEVIHFWLWQIRLGISGPLFG